MSEVTEVSPPLAQLQNIKRSKSLKLANLQSILRDVSGASIFSAPTINKRFGAPLPSWRKLKIEITNL